MREVRQPWLMWDMKKSARHPQRLSHRRFWNLNRELYMQTKQVFNVGDKSHAVCEACQGVVITTFELRDVPFSDGRGVVKGVLVGVCDQCDRVVSIPNQSSPAIAAAAKALGAGEYGSGI